jgi:hypothetical protein
MTLLGALSGGLLIIPLLTLTGAVIFGLKAWKQHTGGSNKIVNGKVTDEEGGKIPIYQTPYFYFSAGLLLATVVILIAINAER